MTTATPSAPVGGPISDTATLSGGANPTGTIGFALYGPDDLTCAGPAVFTSVVPVAGNGVYTSAPPFVPLAVGTYQWVAAYSGDANNLSAATACNDPAEITTVTGAPPTTTTTTSSTSTSTTTAPPGTTTTVPPGSTTTTLSPGTTTTSTAPPGSTTTTATGPPGSTTTSTAPPGTGPTASVNRSQVVPGEQAPSSGLPAQHPRPPDAVQ